jgi:hypothetical protein
MTNNPSFATPLVSLVDIGTANTAFKAAMLAGSTGDRVAISNRKSKREVLAGLLIQQASYVQGVAAGDLTVLLSSGFEAASTNRSPVELEAPKIAAIENPGSAQLALDLVPVPRARSYEIRMSYGTNGSQVAGTFTYARNIVLENLTPGTTYTIQARAIGGTKGYSDWSNSVSRMSL